MPLITSCVLLVPMGSTISSSTHVRHGLMLAFLCLAYFTWHHHLSRIPSYSSNLQYTFNISFWWLFSLRLRRQGCLQSLLSVTVKDIYINEVIYTHNFTFTTPPGTCMHNIYALIKRKVTKTSTASLEKLYGPRNNGQLLRHCCFPTVKWPCLYYSLPMAGMRESLWGLLSRTVVLCAQAHFFAK